MREQGKREVLPSKGSSCSFVPRSPIFQWSCPFTTCHKNGFSCHHTQTRNVSTRVFSAIFWANGIAGSSQEEDLKLLAEMNPNSRRDGARKTRAPRMPSAISALRRSETFLLMSGCWFLGHCCNSVSAFSTTPTIPTAHSHALSLRGAYTPHVSSTRHGWGAALRMAAQDGNEGITPGDKKPPGSVGGLRAMVGATTKRMSDAVRFSPVFRVRLTARRTLSHRVPLPTSPRFVLRMPSHQSLNPKT